MSVRAQNLNQFSSAPKSVHRATRKVQFVAQMEMFIEHSVSSNKRRADLVLFQFHWRIVQQLLSVKQTAILNRRLISVAPTINFIVPNVICEKKIAENTCSLCQWNVAWTRLSSKDATKCVHKNSSRCVAVTIKPTRMNVFWASKGVDHATPFICCIMDLADGETNHHTISSTKNRSHFQYFLFFSFCFLCIYHILSHIHTKSIHTYSAKLFIDRIFMRKYRSEQNYN